MKKLLLTLVLLTTTMVNLQAQSVSDQQANALADLAQKFVLIKVKSGMRYAVMNYPITYWNYFALTGKKMNKNKSITAVVRVSDSEKQRLAQLASSFYEGINVRVASYSELQHALNLNYNIQSENGPYNQVTSGFYLATDEAGYKLMRKLAKQYYEGNTPTTTKKKTTTKTSTTKSKSSSTSTTKTKKGNVKKTTSSKGRAKG